MKPSLIVAGALMLATSAVGAATTEVLVRSGDLATDGVRVAGFEEPVGTGDVAFRGTTSALMTRSGDTFTVLIRTGDALPAPLAGSFATFANPVINDAGAVAFHAAGAGPARVDGVFGARTGSTTSRSPMSRSPAGTSSSGPTRDAPRPGCSWPREPARRASWPRANGCPAAVVASPRATRSSTCSPHVPAA